MDLLEFGFKMSTIQLPCKATELGPYILTFQGYISELWAYDLLKFVLCIFIYFRCINL